MVGPPARRAPGRSRRSMRQAGNGRPWALEHFVVLGYCPPATGGRAGPASTEGPTFCLVGRGIRSGRSWIVEVSATSCADALAILPGDDPGSDPLFGHPRLRPWHRPVGSDAILRDGRRPDRLPVLVLSVPHPDGPGRLEPLRRPRAPEDRPLGRPGIQRRRGPPALGGRTRHRAGPARTGEQGGTSD